MKRTSVLHNVCSFPVMMNTIINIIFDTFQHNSVQLITILRNSAQTWDLKPESNDLCPSLTQHPKYAHPKPELTQTEPYLI